MGDGHQKVRGGGGKQDEPNTPDSNRKGHDEEETLLSGVGNLMKRARRGVNSYFSALARQQKEIAREQRLRHRRKSSKLDFLVDAEEGAGLLSAAGAEDRAGDGLKNGAGASGGPLHRSRSAIFVPSRPEAQRQEEEAPGSTVVVLETRSSGMAADLGELRDVSEAAEFLQGVEGSFEGDGGRLEAGGGSMKRGGRARLTTGDLVRLHREEEQGAGEDSAQDEDRERSGASKVSTGVQSCFCARNVKLKMYDDVELSLNTTWSSRYCSGCDGDGQGSPRRAIASCRSTPTGSC